LLKCDVWHYIVEKNGFSKIKNLLLDDCYLFLDQLPQIQSGKLEQKMDALLYLIVDHFSIG
jgi:hypothetical protein